jgi:integrase/recombinase XerD
MAGKQAKVMTRVQERAVLDHLRYTRNPDRDRALFLLSIKAGLRAKEIAALTWDMVTDATSAVAEDRHFKRPFSAGPAGTQPPGDTPAAMWRVVFTPRHRWVGQ